MPSITFGGSASPDASRHHAKAHPGNTSSYAQEPDHIPNATQKPLSINNFSFAFNIQKRPSSPSTI
jgi:hypothetical protein